MLRSMLVGLDDSPDTDAAIEFGIRWARRFEVMLVGIAVVDKPGICRMEPVGIGGSHFKKLSADKLLAAARHNVDALLSNFARRCTAAAIPHRILKGEGRPYDQIVTESERFDVTALGQNARFRFHAQDGDRQTLDRVLRNSSPPVVIVPAKAAEGNSVVVAYDGGGAACRALHKFVAAGLAAESEVHVVTVCSNREAGHLQIGRAMDYLRLHNVLAIAHVLCTGTPTARAVLEKAVELRAGLLVAGAFGRSKMREVLFGSTTDSLLRDSTIPLFLSH
jgi:nucleotide-binding universal stress UspA family protein